MSTFCPHVVIFDMDGLLVDSEPVWGQVEDAMLSRRGYDLNVTIRERLIGMRMNDFWGAMVREYQLAESAEELIAEVTERMVTAIPGHVEPCPGAQELLDYLHARGVPCAIASSSPMAIINAVVDSEGWHGYFEAFVSGDQVLNGKPAPDIYLEAARQIGADPSVCLTLEDSRNGARAAVAAGMVCYAVPDLSHGHANHFTEITPHVFPSLHEVRLALDAARCFEG
ncbi:MAG TPA: HAD-IA family hydrolase [Candidatus Limnocylindrales bacterium]|nr:HAD-IA family hydrolase [Candidatus Limnocylindrales bacterium]